MNEFDREIQAAVAKDKRDKIMHRRHEMQGLRKSADRGNNLVCDTCGNVIAPPGTGALIGADGNAYCRECRNKMPDKQEFKPVKD